MEIKTSSDLKHEVEARRTESLFFTRNNMKFAGDTMKNYGVRKIELKVRDQLNPIPVYELYRRRAVKGGLKSSTYFDAVTFGQVYEDK